METTAAIAAASPQAVRKLNCVHHPALDIRAPLPRAFQLNEYATSLQTL
jgi:hypothetical protein